MYAAPIDTPTLYAAFWTLATITATFTFLSLCFLTQLAIRHLYELTTDRLRDRRIAAFRAGIHAGLNQPNPEVDE